MKKNICLLFFCACSIVLQAQVPLSEKIAQRNLDDYNDYYQSETVELTIDKNFYFTSDKIWYSLRLSNGTLAVSSLSTLAYVEIRDKNDSILLRQKIKCRLGLAHGEISVPDELPTGYYKLTAFTGWMKNQGNSAFFQRKLLIINVDSPISEKISKPDPQNEFLHLERRGPHSFDVTVADGIQGIVVAFNQDKILLKKAIDSKNPLALNFEDKTDHVVSVLLVDAKGNVLTERQAINMNLASTLTVLPDRKEYSPRSTAHVSVEIRDRSGALINGEVSISIRPKATYFSEQPVISFPINHEYLMERNDKPLQFKKDMFVYPSSQTTLQPILFSASMSAVPLAFNYTSEEQKNAILFAEMKRKVMTYYTVNTFYETDERYNLQFNNTFEPAKYASLPSLEEFIREVVPQIRVRKAGGEKVLRVRNSDNPNKIYFFKESPMILIDRFIVSADDFLSVPLEDVERLEIAWGLNEINSLAVFSLADYGVVSLTTKSKTKYSTSKNELFKSLHNPVNFSVPRLNEKDQAIPILIDPIYWNPSLRVAGRTRIPFEIPDDIGEFIIEVNGVSEQGDHVTDSTTVNVSLRK